MITVSDILKWANEYDGPLFHSAFLDPPYHLGSITDRYGKPGSKPPKDGVFARTASGFMGQDWDSGDIAFKPETWAAIRRLLHPGAFNFAFAGTRGYHRMAVAIEDAGFIVHPLIIWANKQGFPKAQRVDTQIDQAAGEKVKRGKSFNYKGSAGGTHREHENWDERTRVEHDAITPQAKQWEGHRYGLQALRPMLEPICLSEDTEILTADGWKSYNDISIGQTVVSWDSSTGNLSMSPVLNKIVFIHNGVMCRFKNRHTDQLVTEDHRVYCKPIRGVHKTPSEEWEVKLAKDITHNCKLPLSGSHSGGGIGGVDYARLLGWIWTEGTFRNREGRGDTGIGIYQSSTNGDKCIEIDELISKIIPDRKVYTSDREYKGVSYQQYMWWFTGDVARQVRNDLSDKHLSYSLIFRMTMDEKLAFIDAAISGDGHTQECGSQVLAQNDRHDREVFQTMLSLCNRSGSTSDRKDGRGGYVGIIRSNETEVRSHRGQVSRVNYSGYVWCIEVEHSAFLVRRNGRIFITGNCVFQNPFPKGKVKPYQSIVKTGAGTLNIDGAWIETGEGYTRDNSGGQNGIFNASGGRVESEGGHWPANMIIDEEYAADLDEHTAEQFYVASKIYEQIEDADPVVFAAKASISEKEAGLDSMQRRIMVGEDDFEDGRLNDGRKADSERPFLRNKVVRRNIHATVKPIALTRHLATLLLPPEGYQRRLLVPFSGVGSEMIGAMLAGWDYVHGIELVELHAKIARVRLNYWMQWRGMPDLKPKIIRDKKQVGDSDESDVAQTTLF